jgi:hypothetical protein
MVVPTIILQYNAMQYVINIHPAILKVAKIFAFADKEALRGS